MTWLHTWSGLLIGWVCFAIFLTGTATYYRWEITRWMQPEIHQAGTPLDAARSAATRLERDAALSPQWFVSLPDGRQVASTLFWRAPDGPRRFERALIDPLTGEDVKARETMGGEFFYRFHFQLQLPHPWGRYLAGLAAFAMFLALITGIVAHRQFFADFFTFRALRGGVRSWLDFHNVAAVFGLPFYLMITYSALVIFITLYMPWGRNVLTEPRANSAPAVATANTESKSPDSGGKPWIAPAPLGPMLDIVEQTWGTDGLTVRRIEASARGTERCEIKFTRAAGPKLSLGAGDTLRFNGVTGELIEQSPKETGIGKASHDLLYGLHLAHFAGPALRGLFFIMGMGGTALIATGLVLWTVKRRPKQRGPRLTFGHSLVERLNIAALAGMPLACAAFFWANRLLPVDLAHRSEREVQVFLGIWAVSLLHALARPIFQGWREQLRAGAILFLLLPLLDVITTGSKLYDATMQGDWAHAGFDVAMIVCGTILWIAARRVSQATKGTAV